ncbi:uncharacterized protein LOC124172794 [Ischnura elegans]|uniref:uncharacterized protein LOC124172794 n=1 Tax=Ischnura elegans TaxID=197161 RepID=UPI001ED8984F|nr:uncharacterized protein LOC124172794 [Ischnura elegans]
MSIVSSAELLSSWGSFEDIFTSGSEGFPEGEHSFFVSKYLPRCQSLTTFNSLANIKGSSTLTCCGEYLLLFALPPQLLELILVSLRVLKQSRTRGNSGACARTAKGPRNHYFYKSPCVVNKVHGSETSTYCHYETSGPLSQRVKFCGHHRGATLARRSRKRSRRLPLRFNDFSCVLNKYPVPKNSDSTPDVSLSLVTQRLKGFGLDHSVTLARRSAKICSGEVLSFKYFPSAVDRPPGSKTLGFCSVDSSIPPESRSSRLLECFRHQPYVSSGLGRCHWVGSPTRWVGLEDLCISVVPSCSLIPVTDAGCAVVNHQTNCQLCFRRFGDRNEPNNDCAGGSLIVYPKANRPALPPRNGHGLSDLLLRLSLT